MGNAAGSHVVIEESGAPALLAGPAHERPIGVRVPYVLSTTDFNVLVDPARKGELTVGPVARLPFRTLRESES